ncbi:hypothetical protein LINPERHAP1_LOCUS41652 [Linum perenne]
MECTNSNSKSSCPLNHLCKKIHQSCTANPRRITTTATNHHRRRTSSPPTSSEKPSIRVIEIQSKPHDHDHNNHHNHHVAFKPHEYGPSDYGSQKSGVQIEDSFSAYIGRVRKKLRTFSTVRGGEQRSQSNTASDYKFGAYISHVKNKFARTLTTTTTPGGGSTGSKVKPYK